MIEIKKHSGIYTLLAKQELPLSMEEAWAFFSSPKNLVDITPKHMNFVITSENLVKAYAGQIITYRVSPLPGFRSSWVTEITEVQAPNFFIDEQRSGPYVMWHHEHHFEKTENGVMMIDRVSYKLPMGALGRLFGGAFVKKQLRGVFEYRAKKLKETF